MADEDYESDIEIESDSESETKEVNRNTPTNPIPKIEDGSEDELDDISDNDDDENDLEDISDNEDDEGIDEEDGIEEGQKPPIVITNLDINLDEEDDEEDDYDDDENYLQKFGEDCQKKVIEAYHPELEAHNTDEIETLSRVVRNESGQIIDPFHRTIPILSRYEKARILGERAKQLNAGAEPFVEIDETLIDGYLIALKELDEKKIPFIIQRPLPNGACEYWCLRDLEIL